MKKFAKIAGGIFVTAVVGIVGFVSFAYIKTNAQFAKRFDITVQEFSIPSDEASIARGKHLIASVGGCAACHGDDLGGRVESEIPFLVTVRGPNITQGEGSVTLGYTDRDWIRAIRHGVSRDGHGLLFMPSGPFSNMTTADVGAIIAAARTYAPVDRTMAPPVVGPIARVLMAIGTPFDVVHAEKIDHTKPAPQPKTFATPAELGQYLAQIGGCVDCHRKDLSGGRIPGTPESIPPAANLTQAGPIKTYTQAQFLALFRTGKRPNGSELNSMMPWRTVGKADDSELAALYAYLKSLPPVETKD